jgi:class I fructose-bisphosphate aldolase
VEIRAHSAGATRRMGRLFEPRGYSIIIAMDHGIAGVPEAAPDPRLMLLSVLSADPDGVLLNAGVARQYAHELARRDSPALVLGLDQVIHREPGGFGPSLAHGPQISVEEAVRLGADCVKAMLIMGARDRITQLDNLAYLAEASESCRRWGMPFMIEPYLWGEDVPSDPTERARLAADGARMAVEIGADILKVEFPGDVTLFRNLVDASPIPVVVLGGPKLPTRRATVANIVLAAQAGARGVTIGRNVWGYGDPAPMVRALSTAFATKDFDLAIAEIEEPAVARA